MSARKLVEQGTLVDAKGKDGVFPIRIITEGKGSSGTYSRELLERYGSVFANRPMHMNHPKDPSQPWERDVLGIAARTGEVRVGEDEQGRVALYTEAKVRREYREFVEEFGDLIGVSIFASGEGREENGEYIVESFDGEDPYTSVDFVVAAGRGGRVEQMMESYRAIETSVGAPTAEGAATATPTPQSKENDMDIEILAGKVDKLQESINALTEAHTVLAESLKPVETPAEAPDLASVVEAAVAEGLPKESRDVVVESVKAGAEPEKAIAAQKALVESIRKAVSEGEKPAEAAVTGRVLEGAAAGAFDFDFKKVIG